MKCPACGRTMLETGRFAECPNILCDYQEEIEGREPVLTARRDLPQIVFINSPNYPIPEKQRTI
ncbi:MAG: hypothetical protein P8013_05715 [Candidatus Sulfobium sp.]|jgi:hypothetical protein